MDKWVQDENILGKNDRKKIYTKLLYLVKKEMFRFVSFIFQSHGTVTYYMITNNFGTYFISLYMQKGPVTRYLMCVIFKAIRSKNKTLDFKSHFIFKKVA